MWKSRGAWILVLILVGVSGLLGYLAGDRSARDPTAVPLKTSSLEIEEADPPLRFPQMKGLKRASDLRRLIATDRTIRNFARAWAMNPDGLYENTWLGIPAIQNPLDVWITQEIMHEIKPDFVVETGTMEGGSAAIWATFLEFINPDAKIISIDIRDQVTAAKDLPVVQRRVEFLVGDSVSPLIVSQVKKRVAGGKMVMVILDSLHTEEHVIKELRTYSPLVSVGSYLIVQDTGMGVVGGPRHPGAGRAVKTFMKGNREFKIDRSRERLVFTHNPIGFLKRIR